MTGGILPARRPSKRRIFLIGTLALILAGFLWATAVTPGTSSAYIAKITNSTDTASTAANFTCTGAYGVDKGNALFQYPLTEISNSTRAADISGKAANGTYLGSMTANSTTWLSRSVRSRLPETKTSSCSTWCRGVGDDPSGNGWSVGAYSVAGC